VRGACEILERDPLTIANEGKLLAVITSESAQAALAALRALPLAREAAHLLMADLMQADPRWKML